MVNPAPADGAAAAADEAWAATIRRYEERLSRDPGSLAFAPLADAYRKAGRTEDAIRLCREGLGRYPEYNTARLILAKALLDAGDAEAALAETRGLLAQMPADAQAQRLAADLYRRLGRLEESVAHLREAVALDPGDRESRVALEVLGGGLPGASSLARILADDTFVTMSFGTVCLEQGLLDEAAQVFLRLLQKDPGHARARQRLEEALRAKIQRRKGS
jgi:tetratricopeptide (TPR) repeat protein